MVDEAGKPAGYAVGSCARRSWPDCGQELKRPELRGEFVLRRGVDPIRRGAGRQGRSPVWRRHADPRASREGLLLDPDLSERRRGGSSARIPPRRLRSLLAGGSPSPSSPRWRASLGQVMHKRISLPSWRRVGRRSGSSRGGLAARDRREGRDRRRPHGRGSPRRADGSADGLFADRALLLDAAREPRRRRHDGPRPLLLLRRAERSRWGAATRTSGWRSTARSARCSARTRSRGSTRRTSASPVSWRCASCG